MNTAEQLQILSDNMQTVIKNQFLIYSQLNEILEKMKQPQVKDD